MSLQALLIVIGLLIASSPFVGLPHAWLTWIGLLLGLAVAVIGVLLRTRLSRGRETSEISSSPTPSDDEA